MKWGWGAACYGIASKAQYVGKVQCGVFWQPGEKKNVSTSAPHASMPQALREISDMNVTGKISSKYLPKPVSQAGYS